MGALQTFARGAVALVQRSFPRTSGEPTPPPWFPTNWWQLGLRVPSRGVNPVVESCVSAITQTVASLPLHHWRMLPNNGQELILNSPAARLLRKPNRYQTRTDFILNLLRNELFNGNGYAVGLKDENFKFESLHLVNPNSCQPLVSPEGDVFYQIGLSDIAAGVAGVQSLVVPAEDMLHIRMQTPRSPLIGETPLMAAALSIDAGNAIHRHLAGFFSNMTRPSGFLKSTTALKPEQAEILRTEWQQAFASGNAGRVAVLQGGLDWQALTMSAVDAAIVESYRMTVHDIARIFRVPLSVIGEPGGTTYANTETLIRHWLSTGLGFIVEHIELALDALFELPPNEFISFDLEYLLRADFVARVEGLTKGIQGGLFSPNEARAKEGLARAVDGDEPRLQAQVVPLSFASKTLQAATNTPPAAGKDPPPPEDEPEEDETSDEPDEKSTEALHKEALFVLKVKADA
jgi:HK97 family phage portal protein